MAATTKQIANQAKWTTPNGTPILDVSSKNIMEDVIYRAINDFFKRFDTPPPEDICQLFAITKKKEAVKFCKELTIRDGYLSEVITGCELVGYKHVSRFFDSDVDHLWQKLARDNSGESIRNNMYNQLIKESKRSCFHFFIFKDDPRKWHLFFFETTETNGTSRFAKGSHIHFTNYLWGYNLKTIADSLPNRPKSSAHIKTS